MYLVYYMAIYLWNILVICPIVLCLSCILKHRAIVCRAGTIPTVVLCAGLMKQLKSVMCCFLPYPLTIIYTNI